jgi:hypothetical protein
MKDILICIVKLLPFIFYHSVNELSEKKQKQNKNHPIVQVILVFGVLVQHSVYVCLYSECKIRLSCLQDEKKMIRYREGQVVSTKGERFSEIKKQETEEIKKTYVSLKPQKKYRFH